MRFHGSLRCHGYRKNTVAQPFQRSATILRQFRPVLLGEQHTSLSPATASLYSIVSRGWVEMGKVASLSGVRTERSADEAMAGLRSDWLSFWGRPNSIYVSSRHKDVHYRLIAEQIAALVPAPNARVLDYGCGEALHADIVAASAGELLLSDGAPRVRADLAARFAGHAKMRV